MNSQSVFRYAKLPGNSDHNDHHDHHDHNDDRSLEDEDDEDDVYPTDLTINKNNNNNNVNNINNNNNNMNNDNTVDEHTAKRRRVNSASGVISFNSHRHLKATVATASTAATVTTAASATTNSSNSSSSGNRNSNGSSRNASSSAVNSRTSPNCARCRNHGLKIPLIGHKRYCLRWDCVCEKCQQTKERQDAMARETARRRAQKLHEKKLKAYHKALEEAKLLGKKLPEQPIELLNPIPSPDLPRKNRNNNNNNNNNNNSRRNSGNHHYHHHHLNANNDGSSGIGVDVDLYSPVSTETSLVSDSGLYLPLKYAVRTKSRTSSSSSINNPYLGDNDETLSGTSKGDLMSALKDLEALLKRRSYPVEISTLLYLVVKQTPEPTKAYDKIVQAQNELTRYGERSNNSSSVRKRSYKDMVGNQDGRSRSTSSERITTNGVDASPGTSSPSGEHEQDAIDVHTAVVSSRKRSKNDTVPIDSAVTSPSPRRPINDTVPIDSAVTSPSPRRPINDTVQVHSAVTSPSSVTRAEEDAAIGLNPVAAAAAEMAHRLAVGVAGSPVSGLHLEPPFPFYITPPLALADHHHHHHHRSNLLPANIIHNHAAFFSPTTTPFFNPYTTPVSVIGGPNVVAMNAGGVNSFPLPTTTTNCRYSPFPRRIPAFRNPADFISLPHCTDDEKQPRLNYEVLSPIPRTEPSMMRPSNLCIRETATSPYATSPLDAGSTFPINLTK